jgi:hypothetical protein
VSVGDDTPTKGNRVSKVARIAIRAKGRIIFINPAEIVAVHAAGSYISLEHRPNPYLLRESLSS